MAGERPWEVGGEEARWEGYFIPGSDWPGVLRNKLGIVDADKLRRAEGAISAVQLQLYEDDPLPATFDWDHLSGIHRRLFGDIYEWAGEPRTATMTKGGGGPFEPHVTIRERFDELSQIIRDFDGFKGLDHGDFSQMLATTYQVLNQIHPWREGNGRAQRVFLDDLAREAGYQIDWPSVHGQENDRVSEAARMGDQVPMTEMMHRIVGPRPEPTRELAAPAVDLHRAAFPQLPVVEPPPARPTVDYHRATVVDRGYDVGR